MFMVIEQSGIEKAREAREDQSLTWADIQKMKYTWRVSQELLRIIPPVFGSFRKAVKDTSFGDYDIPRGWQVRQFQLHFPKKKKKNTINKLNLLQEWILYNVHMYRYFGQHMKLI